MLWFERLYEHWGAGRDKNTSLLMIFLSTAIVIRTGTSKTTIESSNTVTEKCSGLHLLLEASIVGEM